MATKTKAAANVKKKLGWHFLPASRRLTNGDNRLVTVGQTLSIPKGQTPCTCVSGMHASDTPRQAAAYTVGPVVTRVEVWGDIDEDIDKFCGRNRKVLWMHEVTAADLKALAKHCGYTNSMSGDSVEDAMGSIAANSGIGRLMFNGWFEGLAATAGVGLALKPGKPLFDEKALLAQLLPRTIRTKKEIMRDVGSFYDLTSENDWHDDRFDDLVEDLDRVKIILVENFTATGESGYVLKPSSRR